MNAKAPNHTGSMPVDSGIKAPRLTLSELREQNRLFSGSGGVSEENRALGFRPAFYDFETGDIHLSRFANGKEAPMHLLDGLPEALVAARQKNGRVTEVKPGVITGFVLHGQFYTREQAARATQQMLHRADLLSHPEQHNLLLDVWEQFVVSQSYPPNLMRPVVEDSWRRCQEANVDPLINHAPLSDRDQFERRQVENRVLLNAAQPVLKRAGELLYDSDSLILLADRDGLILHTEADAEVLNSAAKVGLVEGGLWGEGTVGTNSIGTALEAREPVQLYGAEHFCYGIKHWTCSADVIRDPHDGSIIGAVDLSGLTDTYQHDALEFAITVARMIEANLVKDYFQTRQAVIDATRSMFNQWRSEGLLAFDRHGRLVKANRMAFQRVHEFDPQFQLTPQTRINALDMDVPPLPADLLPHWLSCNIHYPIQRGGETIGTLVILASTH
ncbi:GAF domain-containing protein [Marinobacterium sp. D7]|uniref:sigma-54-dependent Fis family transcriptional regulator n=1 Tax=Marinobacterium ramblicola TaxID=2849041 RepID=UPI001C2CFA50|nr:GAF domain-containing protein [Marinobacterium ramblicola]MBV1789859.1 GAF domain-containing protein [Marinobacterium ramblicola]